MERSISLLYHDVVIPGQYAASGFQSPDADVYKLDELQFAKHLEAIGACALPGDRLFTFDDGGASALRTAELLAGHGWRGYFFVPTNFIGTVGFLDALGIQALARSGHKIGSHSCSHPLRMAALPRTQMLEEWTHSRRTLEAILGSEVRTASIPGGYYSKAVAETAAEAGFHELYTSEPVATTWQIGSLRVFGRYSVQRGTSAELVASMAAFALRPRVQQYVYWNLKKLLKTAGGSYWIRFRKSYLRRFAARSS